MAKQKTQTLLSPEKYLRTRARSLPLGPCYINKSWKETGFTSIVVTRAHSNNNITYALFLVDLFCLGVKDVLWRFNEHPLDFEKFLNSHREINEHAPPLVKTNYVLVHNIIYGAIAYAEEIGFHPGKEFAIAKYILEEDDERTGLIDIEFGHKGKPLFVSNPDNPTESNRVMAHLTKRLGVGNFNFITEATMDDFMEADDEYDDDAIDGPADKDAVDYQDPGMKMQIIKDLLSNDNINYKPTEDFDSSADTLLANSNIIYYNYILSDEDKNNALDDISNIFDFEITDELFSDEMLFGGATPNCNIEEIRAKASRVRDLSLEKNTKQWQNDVEAALKKFPDVPIFQYFHLRMLQQKDSKKKFHKQIMDYLSKNQGYYPFGIMLAFDFLTNNPTNIDRSVSANLNLRSFFPNRKSFCEHEVFLNIQVLILKYTQSNQFAHIDYMYSFLAKRHPHFFSKEMLLLMVAMKLPYVVDWCKAWSKENF